MTASQFGGQVRIPKTAEVLASRIRKQIIRGDLKTGDKLPPEAQLIADFEVSRPSIREALRILESEGLINVSRGARGGARVNAVSSDMVTRAAGLALQARGATIHDIYEMRSLVEPPAARLAAERCSATASAALRREVDEGWAAKDDHNRRAHAVANFHRVLLEECGNVTLAVVGAALQAVVERHMELTYRNDPPHKSKNYPAIRDLGLRSQERLVELIAAGKGAEAEAHWVRHMQAASEYWVGKLAKTAIIDILE